MARTNITDTPGNGSTTTTLVSSHDRGSKAYNARTGGGDPFGSNGPPSSGATAGIPGTWTPSGSQPPATVTMLTQGNPVTVTASPATAWTGGQYVQTRTAGAAGRATWSGTGWVGGVAP